MFSDARIKMARTAGEHLARELIEATVGEHPVWDGANYVVIADAPSALAAARSRIEAAAARQSQDPEIVDAFTQAAIVGLHIEMRLFARCMAIAPFPNQWRRYSVEKSIAS